MPLLLLLCAFVITHAVATVTITAATTPAATYTNDCYFSASASTNIMYFLLDGGKLTLL